MRCGRISVEGEAEEIAVSPGPRSRQRHGKRSNPYSTSGLDKFESVCAELSAKREHVANKIGVPEGTVRFVSSKKGWTPVVIAARDQGTGKKTSGGGAAGASILGPVEKSDCVTHEHEHNHHHNSKTEKIRWSVPMDNRHSTRPGRYLQESDSYDTRFDATIMIIITLLCLVFYDRLCAILLTSAWLYLFPMLREGSERMREMNRNHDIMTVYLQSSEFKKKVILGGFMDRRRTG